MSKIEINNILEQWRNGIRTAHVGHRLAATHFDKLGRQLGVASAITSAIVGTALFSTLGALTSALSIQIALGLLSVLAAVLTALQTFLNSSERAEQHLTAAAKYGDIRRLLEQLWISTPKAELARSAELTLIRERWGQLDENSPAIPHHIYFKAQLAIAKDDMQDAVETNES